MTTPEEAWAAMVDGLRVAGEKLAANVAELGVDERADAHRALLRAFNNQLGRFEVDRERPELVSFNGWRGKMFMDNPDFQYWVADIRDDRRYRITGTRGDAMYLSLTAYTSGGTLDAAAAARLDSDAIAFDADGRFEVVLSREQPTAATGWLQLPEGATSVWVRFFHHDAANDALGTCRIEPLDPVPPAPFIDAERFSGHLERLGRGVASFPTMFDRSVRDDLAAPNAIRHWSEMTGGAAFTEPNIAYLRGAWQLDEDEALVIEGEPPPCRYWNALLYSRFLNSLDFRSRTVSRTDATATTIDGRYRFVLAGRDPHADGDWLDTEDRRFGLFVLRFLQPASEPLLPTVRVVRIADLEAGS